MTVPEARRCIQSIANYLRRQESPRAAADLIKAMKALIAEATKRRGQ